MRLRSPERNPAMKKPIWIATVFAATFGLASEELPPLGVAACFAILVVLLFDRYVWKDQAPA